MKRHYSQPNDHRLSVLHTLEVSPIDGNVWLEISHGLVVSVTALFPDEARTIGQALLAAADKAGGKPRKIDAGVRLSGRAAMTAEAKAGGTQKRRAAKRDKGTAEARADAGSSPAPGFRKLRNVRYF